MKRIQPKWYVFAAMGSITLGLTWYGKRFIPPGAPSIWEVWSSYPIWLITIIGLIFLAGTTTILYLMVKEHKKQKQRAR